MEYVCKITWNSSPGSWLLPSFVSIHSREFYFIFWNMLLDLLGCSKCSDFSHHPGLSPFADWTFNPHRCSNVSVQSHDRKGLLSPRTLPHILLSLWSCLSLSLLSGWHHLLIFTSAVAMTLPWQPKQERTLESETHTGESYTPFKITLPPLTHC